MPTANIILGIFYLLAISLDVISADFLIVTDGNFSAGPVGTDYWLHSGPIFMRHNGQKLDTDNRTLMMENVTYSKSGLDKLGYWQDDLVILHAPDNVTMEARLRNYPLDEPNIVIFTQTFPQGLKGSRASEGNSTITGYPTFRLSNTTTNTSLAYLMFAGYMAGDRSKVYGRWTPGVSSLPGGLDGSGPLVLFDAEGNVLLLSVMDQSMAANVWLDGDVLSYGVMGGVDSLPPGFSMQVLLYLGNQGIGQAFKEWGRILREWHGKTDDVTAYHQTQDITLTHLGYWTDNGAYYYYHTESEKNYEQTLPDVTNYASKQHIPYRYIQLDSWWYPKDNIQAVTKWDAMPSIFPHGLRNLSSALKLPIAAHNRFWSVNTTYAKKNGGQFDFFVGKYLALPTSQDFWQWLMKTSSQWGLRMYEQDWLNIQTAYTELLHSSVTAGADWLDGMARAARDHNMTVQYCMAQSRHALYSLRWPEVTQIRVTDDYHLYEDNWKIGVTSHLAAALGLAPSKDTFWTTSEEPGNPFNKTEPYPELQSAVATLSTGPVGPGDGINLTDRENLMRCCARDGLILKPSRPITAIDAMLLEMGFGEGAGTSGEVWSTYSDFDFSLTFGIVLTFNVTRSFQLTPYGAGFSPMVPQFPKSKLFERSNPEKLYDFSEQAPVEIGPSTCDTSVAPFFCLFYSSPVFSFSDGSTVVLIGELDKWVPVSDRRVLNIRLTSDSLTLTLRGDPGEVVNFFFQQDGRLANTSAEVNAVGCATLVISSPTMSSTPSLPSTTEPSENTTSQEATTTEYHNTTSEEPSTTAANVSQDTTETSTSDITSQQPTSETTSQQQTTSEATSTKSSTESPTSQEQSTGKTTKKSKIAEESNNDPKRPLVRVLRSLPKRGKKSSGRVQRSLPKRGKKSSGLSDHARRRFVQSLPVDTEISEEVREFASLHYVRVFGSLDQQSCRFAPPPYTPPPPPPTAQVVTTSSDETSSQEMPTSSQPGGTANRNGVSLLTTLVTAFAAFVAYW